MSDYRKGSTYQDMKTQTVAMSYLSLIHPTFAEVKTLNIQKPPTGSLPQKMRQQTSQIKHQPDNPRNTEANREEEFAKAQANMQIYVSNC